MTLTAFRHEAFEQPCRHWKFGARISRSRTPNSIFAGYNIGEIALNLALDCISEACGALRGDEEAREEQHFFFEFVFFTTTFGHCLLLTQLAETTDGRTNSDGSSGGGSVGTTGGDLVATEASPDSNVGTLHGVLTAELARVLGVLSNFDLADLLTDGSTIASTVFSDDSDLLSSASLLLHKTHIQALHNFRITQ